MRAGYERLITLFGSSGTRRIFANQLVFVEIMLPWLYNYLLLKLFVIGSLCLFCAEVLVVVYTGIKCEAV